MQKTREIFKLVMTLTLFLQRVKRNKDLFENTTTVFGERIYLLYQICLQICVASHNKYA